MLNACTGCPSSRAPSWLVGVGVVLVIGNGVVCLAPVVAIVLFCLAPCIFFSALLCIHPLCNVVPLYPGRLMALLIQSRARVELLLGSAGGFALKIS